MAAQSAFWLDDSFDREHAPEGKSRYAAEVRRRVAEFDGGWGDPVAFAVTAWRVAVTLSPGFVRWHRRIGSASCRRSDWDGGLIFEASVVSPWPAELTWTRQWGRDRGWRDWPQLFGQYVPPSEEDLTRAPHLRSLLYIEAPVPLDQLPPAPDGPDGEVEQNARRAVTVLVRELNDLLSPMIGQLEDGVPT